MTDPARVPEQLPAEVVETMEAAGFSPQIATLLKIIESFRQAQADVRAKAEHKPERMWPLKAVVPGHVGYEAARRAVERGHLEAVRVGGRWYVTETAMDRWLSVTGRSKRR